MERVVNLASCFLSGVDGDHTRDKKVNIGLLFGQKNTVP